MKWLCRLYGTKITQKYQQCFKNFLMNKPYCTNTKIKSTPPWNVLFFGSDTFALETLSALNQNRLNGKNKVVDKLEVVATPRTVIRKYSVENNLKVYDWPVTLTPGQYDVGILVSFGNLIPTSIINSFPYGILNIHASLLPRWRGAAPIVHTLLNNDTETGVTIMKIKPKQFDTGQLLIQKMLQVPHGATHSYLCDVLSKEGTALLLDNLKNLPELVEQDLKSNYEITYTKKINEEFGRINWNDKCEDIYRLYRALHGLKPVYTTLNGQKVTLLDMLDPEETKDHVHTDKFKGSPNGTVRWVKLDNILLVKCQDGLVGFKRTKKRYTAREFFSQYLQGKDRVVFDTYK